jgi:hypothetical protein
MDAPGGFCSLALQCRKEKNERRISIGTAASLNSKPICPSNLPVPTFGRPLQNAF